jgi:hypothetical protein
MAARETAFEITSDNVEACWAPEEPNTSAGIYVPPSGAWLLRNTHGPGRADLAIRYGPASLGWKPLAGDWNGDEVDTIGLYDATTASWFLRNSNSPGIADLTFGYGPPKATPVVGNWDGL